MDCPMPSAQGGGWFRRMASSTRTMPQTRMNTFGAFLVFSEKSSSTLYVISLLMASRLNLNPKAFFCRAVVG
jgi:hypothetical protein